MNNKKNLLKLIDMKFHRSFYMLVSVIGVCMIVSAIISSIKDSVSEVYFPDMNWADWPIGILALERYAVEYIYIVLTGSLFFAIFLAEHSDVKLVAAYGIGRMNNALSNIVVAFFVALTFAVGITVSSLINIAFMRVSGGYWISRFMSAEIAKEILFSLYLNIVIALSVIMLIQFVVSLYRRNKYVGAVVGLGIVLLISLPFFGISLFEEKVRRIIFSRKWGGLILLGLNTVITIGYIISERFCEVRR